MIRMSDAGPNPRTSTHLFYQQKKKRGQELPGGNISSQHFSMIAPVDAEVLQE